MLYDALLKQLQLAKLHIEHKAVAHKAAAIANAIRLIDHGLRLGLDLERGGHIAEQLLLLYDYCVRRLRHANLHNEAAAIDEVVGLLDPIRTAWQAMDPDVLPEHGRDPKQP
jgi:flagellar protein FliS